MAEHREGKGTSLFDAINVGGGTTIKKVSAVSVAVDPASLAAATKAGTAVTVTGVAAGDVVIAVPPAALEDDLLPAGARVTAADEVTIYLYNPTGAPIDGASRTWDLVWFDLT